MVLGRFLGCLKGNHPPSYDDGWCLTVRKVWESAVAGQGQRSNDRVGLLRVLHVQEPLRRERGVARADTRVADDGHEGLTLVDEDRRPLGVPEAVHDVDREHRDDSVVVQ